MGAVITGHIAAVPQLQGFNVLTTLRCTLRYDDVLKIPNSLHYAYENTQ